MRYLRRATAVDLVMGPAVGVTDGVNPVESLTASIADAVGVYKHAATTFTSISGAAWGSFNTITGGMYVAKLTSDHVDTVGNMRFHFRDASAALPIWDDFYVMERDVYDSFFATGGPNDGLDRMVSGVIAAQVAQEINALVSDIVAVQVAQELVVYDALISTGLPALISDVIKAQAGTAQVTQTAEAVWDVLMSDHTNTLHFGGGVLVSGDRALLVEASATAAQTYNALVSDDVKALVSDVIATQVSREIVAYDALTSGDIVALITDALATAVRASLISYNALVSGDILVLRSAVTAGSELYNALVSSDLGIVGQAVASQVWDEILTGAIHNVTNSAGRRLRIIQESGSYHDGQVYIDTVDGTAGTTDFESGVEILPVDTIGSANTIADSIGLKRFRVIPGSSITLATEQVGNEFEGINWSLALGGQDISDAYIHGADVSGLATGTSEPHFENCEIEDATIGLFHMDNCDLAGTLKVEGPGGTIILDNCFHSATGPAILDFQATVSDTTAHVHQWHGHIQIENMGQEGIDTLHFDCPAGKLTLATTNIGGTLNLFGNFQLVSGDALFLPCNEIRRPLPIIRLFLFTS